MAQHYNNIIVLWKPMTEIMANQKHFPAPLPYQWVNQLVLKGKQCPYSFQFL